MNELAVDIIHLGGIGLFKMFTHRILGVQLQSERGAQIPVNYVSY